MLFAGMGSLERLVGVFRLAVSPAA
jgi:hypothetical protein